MKYLLALPIFAILIFSCTAKTYSELDSESNMVSLDSIEVRDTTTVFNYDTYVEKTTVVVRKASINDLIAEITTSGKSVEIKDTFVTYNYDSYDEQTEVYHYAFPVEYNWIFQSLDIDQQKTFAAKYGTFDVEKIR